MYCIFCKDLVSGVAAAALSKNQKKRARKRAKKATEGGGTDDSEGVRSGEAERVREIEERIVIDPAVELKMKLEEAKANKVWMVNTYNLNLRPPFAIEETCILEFIFILIGSRNSTETPRATVETPRQT